MQQRRLKLAKEDPWLVPVETEINDRYLRFRERLSSIESDDGSLIHFADGHHYFGIQYNKKRNGWFYREWAPHAEDLYLFGDFNDWQRYSHRLTRQKYGIWELFLPEEEYKDRFTHESKIKVLIHSDAGWHEKIPAYIRRVVQDPVTLGYSGQVWLPPAKFNWEGDRFDISILKELIIYETHVGMAQEREGIGTFVGFADYILPYIKNVGYNTIQLMAIAEHPYYGSFGYHVTNFFAVSGRFGTPEDLKYLIKKAHEQGIAVIMDLVHSHAAKNTLEGLNQFDGSDNQYFHPGERGNHPHWDSKIFDYGKPEVLRFLLSNIKFWLQEFHFDGFRFDGITSMIYFDHGFRDVWDLEGFFGPSVEWDAITYLQLANTLVHKINPKAVTIAEDVSGMPGMCRPIREGGIGFDYRLGMAIPDFWIRILKEKKDEEWDIHEMWQILNDRLPNVRTVAYCESHDQALVGDQTIAFRLMQSEIYFRMSKRDQSVIIDRGIALHKMIRLITAALGGQAYMNFMGNEFGHPDWIDFPREGNNWSFRYARRQWSLVENPDLKYRFLGLFDRDMVKLLKSHNILPGHFATQLNMDDVNKTIIFEKQELIFVFNFHPDLSIPDYQFQVSESGDYRSVLNTDNVDFGGQGRIDETKNHTTLFHPETKTNRLSIYNTNRTAQVFQRIY
ncbi:MAG: alpha amylase C-terminal domain-containing protein [Bacteroidales bacterium]|nr:alpha amylase C-terminal domain-containing protein [Bacteroidota bacterium]MBL6949714.1 alpha amylase C-terminal domain-containing protein [Bacteroidales bacterium]